MGTVKNRFYNFFDDIGELITSRAIVIILMVPFMWYRFYEFETLFNKWLPIPDPSSRHLASRLISLVFITITLLFMVNTQRLFAGVKVILAITAFTLNIFFWSLGSDLNWWFIVFISAVIASMDYGQAHLFDSQWREHQVSQSIEELDEQLKEKGELILSFKEDISEKAKKVAELNKQVTQFICPYCREVFWPEKSINAHIPKCPSNKSTSPDSKGKGDDSKLLTTK